MNAALVQTVAVPTVFFALWALERRWPARAFVAVKGWGWRGLLFFGLTALVGSVVPAVWALSPLSSHSLFDWHREGWWAVPVGVLAVTFVNYWWHRAAHHFDLLWLFTHQLHHSAQRVDMPGAFYVHPAEVALKGSLSFVVLYGVLGFRADAAVAVTTITALLSLFEHWNGHTPRWLGVIVARPEMHCLHHEYGVHGRNYGLPLWDWLFRTYVNPESVGALRVGFDDLASARTADLLLGRDVNQPDSQLQSH